MTNEQNRLNDSLIEKAKKAFERNGFDVLIADNRKNALDMLKQRIPKESSIGTGGSRTLEEIGFFEYFLRFFFNLFYSNSTFI